MLPEFLDEPDVPDVRDELELPEVRDELELPDVAAVRLVPVEVEDEAAAPRRVVVDEPSVFTVLVVVRAEPLVFTLDVVVVLAGLTLRDVLVLVPLVWLVRLVEVELPVPLDELVLLVVPEVPEVRLVEVEEPLVWLVRLEDVLPVVVVVVVFEATRCCSSRALLIAAVRLLPEVFSLATRFENDCSGWRVS